jgi:ubiquinone/menaquinone biosynthesis C-methylase UbiE
MEITELFKTPMVSSAGRQKRLISCLPKPDQKEKTEWVTDQLRIQPYQHILEIGYGTGSTLFEVTRQLRIGFVAGTDPDINMYKLAFRRNKKAVQQQLLQLHLGAAEELPYPHHYFHTVYDTNCNAYTQKSFNQFSHAYHLLKPGGKFITLIRSSANPSRPASFTALIEQEMRNAGFSRVEINTLTVPAFGGAGVIAVK